MVKKSSKFKMLSQIPTKQILQEILHPLIKGNQLNSFFILILRILSFGLLFNIKDRNKEINFKNSSSEKFILDLRDAKLNLHLFGVLSQYFTSFKKKYSSFQIYLNEHSFSLNPKKMYLKEFNSMIDLLQKSIGFSVLSNSKKNLSSESSFIKISLKEGSRINGEDFNTSRNLKYLFNEKFSVKSEPVDFYLNEKLIENNLNLFNCLKNNFAIIFYPTYDENLRFEVERRKYGVISKANFINLEKFYYDLQEEISKKNLSKLKIILLNKKSLGWKYYDNVIDLRNFEDYNLSFSELISILNSTCNWTIGSEGTLSYYLMLCKKLKHFVIVDNTHWDIVDDCDGASVPEFYDHSGINYFNAPKEYVPSDYDQIKEVIFRDYNTFIKKD